MDIETKGQLAGIIRTLEMMMEIEKLISEYYQVCKSAWPQNAQFWDELSKEEIKHAKYISKMLEIIKRKPGKFESYRPFNPFSINTTMKGIAEAKAKVMSKQINEKSALAIALDFEKSLLELRYGEIVKTDDLEYNNLLKEILSDTYSHKGSVEIRLKNGQR